MYATCSDLAEYCIRVKKYVNELNYMSLFICLSLLFQIIAPQFKHFQKLRDFVEIKLPPGFPVKVDIPVLPTVSARVTFHDFAWKNTKTNPRSAAMQNGTGRAEAAAATNGENGWSEGDEEEDSARKRRRSLKAGFIFGHLARNPHFDNITETSGIFTGTEWIFEF